MSKEQWQARPDRLTVRQASVRVDVPGFRTRTSVLVTTRLDPKAFPAATCAELYRKRWAVELYLRHIKITMGIDVLRCKTSEMVEKELRMHLIAYNLIRALLPEAVTAHVVHLERLSVKGTIATIRQWAPTLAQAQSDPTGSGVLYQLMLHCIAADPVPNRRNRTEPRARKRRPKNDQLPSKPRRLFREICHRSRHRKSKN